MLAARRAMKDDTRNLAGKMPGMPATRLKRYRRRFRTTMTRTDVIIFDSGSVHCSRKSPILLTHSCKYICHYFRPTIHSLLLPTIILLHDCGQSCEDELAFVSRVTLVSLPSPYIRSAQYVAALFHITSPPPAETVSSRQQPWIRSAQHT